MVISALKRTHVVYNKPRLRWVMTVMRMMHSEIDSPRSRHLLQPTARVIIDRYLPVAIWQPPRSLVYVELERNQWDHRK